MGDPRPLTRPGPSRVNSQIPGTAPRMLTVKNMGQPRPLAMKPVGTLARTRLMAIRLESRAYWVAVKPLSQRLIRKATKAAADVFDADSGDHGRVVFPQEGHYGKGRRRGFEKIVRSLERLQATAFTPAGNFCRLSSLS